MNPGVPGVTTDSPWVLVRGDMRTELPQLQSGSIDVIITDPPYSQHVHECNRRGHTGYVEKESSSATYSRTRDLGFAFLDPELRRVAAAEFARLVRRWVVVFSDHEGGHDWGVDLAAAGLEVVRFGIWVKEGSTPQFTGDRPGQGHEVLVIAHPPGRKRWNGGGRPGVYTCPIVLDRGRNGARVHTTQKPLELMEALVRDFTDPGELILDPFAGSATTGVAALRNGRRFHGIELDPKHAATAAKRLRATREQGTLALEGL